MSHRLSLFWISLVFLVSGCEDDDLAPVAVMSVNSHFGYTGRVFTFSASGSTDVDNDPLGLKCRWDFETDGIWDTPYSLAREVNHWFDTWGVFRVTLEVVDPDGLTSQVSDTLNILGPLPDSSITDPRDNQTYRVVRIKNLWIMAENLRYGQMILTDQEPADNQVTEYYAYNNDAAHVPQYGGLYSWWEAMNYENHTNNQGACPPGWRIPDTEDIQVIDLPVSHLFISDYYAKGGVSGFNVDFPGIYMKHSVEPQFCTCFAGQGHNADYWSTQYKYYYQTGIYESAALGCFSFFEVSNDLNIFYKGKGIIKQPMYHYWWTYDGMYHRNYVSVRCVRNYLAIH
jgi:uncharacterized protein (TIGR02145 family)